jgi:hypothetical protein
MQTLSKGFSCFPYSIFTACEVRVTNIFILQLGKTDVNSVTLPKATELVQGYQTSEHPV